ncbi:hypothetical protein SCLARK_00318 [Spiroplasma clarkii]|uniref:Uncharacterized protein n=1 Tax=Spiroplasma clarkii TaxID=2139 RepID=A0A1Y0KZ89_9MOLU|nr:hypothetical protein [Spiroplasma clarkii]ARU91072.1 hypothetical protein SCLARK_00318 [Spiroplasma clarkii]ATX70508.1 hypothetical protein SCLAR_v1c01770 [Spiroplasma clarkii]
MKDLLTISSFNLLRTLKTKAVFIGIPFMIILIFALNVVFATFISGIWGIKLAYTMTIMLSVIYLVFYNVFATGTSYVVDSNTGIQGLMVRRGAYKWIILYTRFFAAKVITFSFIALSFSQFIIFLHVIKPLGYDLYLDGYVYGILALIPFDILFSGFVILVTTMSFRLKAILPLGWIVGIFSSLYWVLSPIFYLFSTLSSFSQGDNLVTYNAMKLIEQEKTNKTNNNFYTLLRKSNIEYLDAIRGLASGGERGLLYLEIKPDSNLARALDLEAEPGLKYFIYPITDFFGSIHSNYPVRYNSFLELATRILEGDDSVVKLAADYVKTFPLFDDSGVTVRLNDQPDSFDDDGRTLVQKIREKLENNLYLKFINAIGFTSTDQNEKATLAKQSWYMNKTTSNYNGEKQFGAVLNEKINMNNTELVKLFPTDTNLEENLNSLKEILQKQFKFGLNIISPRSDSFLSYKQLIKVSSRDDDDEQDREQNFSLSDAGREKIEEIEPEVSKNIEAISRFSNTLPSTVLINGTIGMVMKAPGVTSKNDLEGLEKTIFMMTFNPFTYFFTMTLLSGKEDFYYDDFGISNSILPAGNFATPNIKYKGGNPDSIDHSSGPVKETNIKDLSMEVRSRPVKVQLIYFGFIAVGILLTLLAYLPYSRNIYKKGAE